MDVLALLKVIESYNEKSVIYFCVTKAKIIVIENRLKKMFEFVFYTIV